MRILIVQDPKENPRKCSLTPLEGRPGVTFVRPRSAAWDPGKIRLGSGVLLALDAPLLEPADGELLRGAGALILPDATWARLPKLLRRIEALEGEHFERRRLPQHLQTAYPRVSKVHTDPAGGLASVEALFAATVLLGAPRPDLLEGYRWAEEFLRRNGWQALATNPASRVS